MSLGLKKKESEGQWGPWSQAASDGRFWFEASLQRSCLRSHSKKERAGAILLRFPLGSATCWSDNLGNTLLFGPQFLCVRWRGFTSCGVIGEVLSCCVSSPDWGCNKGVTAGW
jgi:hypothetical protein